MPEGSCLCGAVVYTVSEPLEQMAHCHCSMCRKLHGTPFASYVSSPGVSFLKGTDHISMYESSPGFHRCFCDSCGSVLPELNNDGGNYFVPVGGLHDKINARPEKHIFTESKASWYEINDQLPQVQEYGENSGFDSVPQKDRSGANAGFVSGSCLCGDVAFRYPQGAAKLMMYCHCSRCRKVKGAAHASNVFVAADDFEWLQGQSNVQIYDLPEADRFGNSFCKRCGSSVPRQANGGPMFNIPAGALDDAPGIEPRGHIFIGSKSEWFEIHDQLPQHDKMPPG